MPASLALTSVYGMSLNRQVNRFTSPKSDTTHDTSHKHLSNPAAFWRREHDVHNKPQFPPAFAAVHLRVTAAEWKRLTRVRMDMHSSLTSIIPSVQLVLTGADRTHEPSTEEKSTWK
jgi:hypothetical protein